MIKKGYSDKSFGLLGKKLGHSFSELIHGEIADYSFRLCEVEENELEKFVCNCPLDGFCITVPYKQAVMPFLHSISPEALSIGAVNAVVRDSDGKLKGHNTDFFGFKYLLLHEGISPKGKKALIIGKGGAAVTVSAVLRDMGISQTVLLNSRENTPENIKKYADSNIVVNASPVGMYPHNGISPVDLRAFPHCEAVADLVYNPSKTKLLLDAEKLGIKTAGGIKMLAAQAAGAFEFFTGDTFEEEYIDEVVKKVTDKTENIVLIGMPGCGKSTVGKLLAQLCGKKFIDADDEFSRVYSMTPAMAITTLGEERFREMETEVTAELGKLSGAVIATGGGVVTREQNHPLLAQNGKIVFLERSIDMLPTEGRPISQNTSLRELYEYRLPLYRHFADITVNADTSPEETARRTAEAI